MERKPLIGICICAVVLLVMASFSNAVGYQSVKSTVNDSPLFKTRTQRATNQQQNTLTSQYLGKGINALSFPLRDTTTEMIQQFLDKIRTIDDDTFNRFIDFAINQINHKNNIKDVNDKELINVLNHVRESRQNIIINKDIQRITFRYNLVITICWFPGCLILGLIGVILFIYGLWAAMKTPTSWAHSECWPH